MNLQSNTIQLFLLLAASRANVSFGLLPSSSTCRVFTQNGKSLTLSSPLAVSSSPTRVNNNILEDGDDVYLEMEDDDEDHDIDTSQKQIWVQELERLAHTSSRDPDATSKAQTVFDEMFEAYIKTDDSTFFPTVDIYNRLIECHAYGKEENGGDEAELILSRMEDDSNDFVARPNLETYLNVMDAWAMRKNPERVESVVARLDERYGKTNDESLKPTVEVNNKLIKTYGIVEDIERAESLFRNSLDLEEGDLKANYKSWIQIMN